MENSKSESLELRLSESPTIAEILAIEKSRAEGEFFLVHGPTQLRVTSLVANGKRIVVHFEGGESLGMQPASVRSQIWKVDLTWQPEILATKNPQLVGTAGVYYVMAQLAFRGFHAAATHGNAPHIDILVSSPDGGATLAIQVKTTEWAVRTRGRGGDKKPHTLDFALGHKAAAKNRVNLFFAFVDLKNFGGDGKPEVYIIPSNIVYEHCKEWANNVKMVRFQPTIAELEPFKNGWLLLTQALISHPIV